MLQIQQFSVELAQQFPQTHKLLCNANVWVHQAVDRVILHGSRGPKGGAGDDSDLDLSLVINTQLFLDAFDKASFLREVLSTTKHRWDSAITLDVAAVFERQPCGLRCMNQVSYKPGFCSQEDNCLGIYTYNSGFDGFLGSGNLAARYPQITAWSRRKVAARPAQGWAIQHAYAG